jgi:magnesium-protoporphyrin O-methyltransferase
MPTLTYLESRERIETYFDRTAAATWDRLTSDAPVSGIRATVRAGRAEMRERMLSWLPADLTGRRILDAGCGTGVMAMELARRGADVTAVDLSPTLVAIAAERAKGETTAGSVTFLSGDMLDPALGRFDHVVAMDSLIHYRAPDAVATLTRLARRTDRSIVFTFAPRTPALAVMHAAGKLFPRSDRSPAIEPVAPATLKRLIGGDAGLGAFRAIRTQRTARGFYISQAMELARQ